MRDVASCLREYARLEQKRSGAGLTPKELLRWTQLKRALAREFKPGLDDTRCDMRGSLRVPTRLEVSFRSLSELERSLMTNLNRGGVFVQTEAPAQIGMRMTLCIRIAGEEDLEVPVEVVSTNVGPNFDARTQGMGMRFLELAPEVEKRISELYHRELSACAQRVEAPAEEE